MKPSIFITVILFLLVISCKNENENNNVIRIIKDDNLEWSYADSIQKTIQSPEIPGAVFTVPNNSGAVEIQKVIDRAASAGGGTVSIPKGTHLSLPLQLKSNVHLFLEDGAVLKFLPLPEQYPLVYTWFEGIPCMNYSSMIYAKDQVNIKISGNGSIDGQGNQSQWKDMKYREEVDWNLLKDMEDENIAPEHRTFGKGHSLRPDLVTFVNCKKIEISGVTILNSPYFAIHPILCEDLIINNLRIDSKGYNQIGVVPESSCRIFISKVSIGNTNDGIRIKSGRVKDPSLKSSQDILIRNSVIHNIAGEGIAIGTKVIGGVTRVFISNVTIDGARRGITISTDAELKGSINQIYSKDIIARNIIGSVIQCRISNGTSDYRRSILSNLHFENISADSCGRAFEISGYSKQPIQNVIIKNSRFVTFKGIIAEDVINLNLAGVTDGNNIFNKRYDITDIKTDKLESEESEEDILDKDDIPFDNLNDTVKNIINSNYSHVPIENISRILTRTNVNYEVEFILENSQSLGLLISSSGEIIRSERDIPFRELPVRVLTTLRSSIRMEPVSYQTDEIKKISVRDFNYYEIRGETREVLFLLGVAEDGNIIEEKQKQITWTLPIFTNKLK